MNHHEPPRTTMQKSPQITTNDYKPPQTTTNHHTKITTNHYQSLQTTTNHHEPPHENHHKSLQTTTRKSPQITTNHHNDPKRALHKAIWLPCCTMREFPLCHPGQSTSFSCLVCPDPAGSPEMVHDGIWTHQHPWICCSWKIVYTILTVPLRPAAPSSEWGPEWKTY